MNNEGRHINRLIFFAWNLIMVVLAIGYVLEMLRGSDRWLIYVTFLMSAWIPLIIGDIFYFRNKEDPRFKYIAAYGYLFFYVYALMWGKNLLMFIYIVPILSALFVTNEYKLLRNVGIITVMALVAKMVQVIFIWKELERHNMEDIMIYVFLLPLTMFLAYSASKTSSTIFSNKIKKIEEHEHQMEELLNHIYDFNEGIHKTIDNIYDEVTVMADRAGPINSNIEGIVQSSIHTASSINRQKEMTNSIQQSIDDAARLSAEISKLTQNSDENIRQGMKNMKALSTSAKSTKESIDTVKVRMEDLNKKAEEAKDIIDIINEVAEQTNLLALNASIEAARAGEAGRGFAVVASEINSLANQTKNATESIGSLINGLKSDASTANASVDVVTEISEKQNNLIFETEESFNVINASMKQVTDNVERQKNQMEEMKNSNLAIVASIDDIAQSSEMMMINSDSTKALTIENSENTEEVKGLLGQISSDLRDFEQERLKN